MLALLCSFWLGCGADSPTAPSASINGEASPTESEGKVKPEVGSPPANLFARTPGTAAYDPDKFQPFRDNEPSRNRGNLHPIVVLQTNMGDIKIRLNREKAPVTAANFLDNYVDRGFYENIIFHFVEDGFMMASGGFTEDFTAKPPRTPIANESHNGLKNVRGSVAMIRDPQYDKSATSQFFINLSDNTDFDYVDPNNTGYCVFGEVLEESMPVVQRIAKSPVGETGAPVEPVVITSVKRL